MKVINVPKTPVSAYNPGRPASDLLRAQVAHLEAAAGIAPRDGRNRRGLRTEGQVAGYIAELTRRLNPQLDADPAVRLEPPTVAVPVRVRRKHPKSKATSPARPVSARRRSKAVPSRRTTKSPRVRARRKTR
ncbi:MAG TPA: hypothetical protein VHI99_26695 [Vicinamibacterales bacterium]|jgi:hypothetical protein|nr:hypothetical protein [Vicinamibacterales bacterium]